MSAPQVATANPMLRRPMRFGRWILCLTPCLTVVGALTREALAIDVEPGIKGEQVVETMSRITAKRGAPKTIRVDNGPEFISKALGLWAYEMSVLTQTGSWLWTTLEARLRRGDETIMRPVLTHP